MRSGKKALAAVLVLVGLAAPVHAQQFGVGNGVGFGGFGYNSGYNGFGYGTGFNSGFGSAYPGAYGYNTGGYLPYYQTVPQTYNNLGGLTNAIRTQTGRANSYRANSAIGGFRRR